ncbi:MAG TPA: cytochrome c biogenesis protein CcsA [Flavobacteriales bacterium]|jgi:cytochrome c-type biogenesis protein CcsB|nr:cytochrome c biogenesis protein CcsA [Flavobacteriales bacterium]|tara:strand:- start:486 stop:3545 length:3060 start_codon:yes stop_codon:yes gene_type:complete
MKFAAILLFAFAFSIGYATFIENDFGTRAAKALIFNSWWLEVILILLCLSLILSVIKNNMFCWSKITILVYHLAFIIILIGAGTTRYFGTEGMMHIREGRMENSFVSDDLYLQIKVDDKTLQYEYNKRLFLSPISNNNFSIPIDFLENDISIEYADFIPNVKDSLFDNIAGGIPIMHLVVPGNNGMQSVFLLEGEQKIIANNTFTLNNPQEKAINLFYNDSLMLVANFDIESMSMLDRSTATLSKNKRNNLTTKKLYSAENLQFVVKEIHAKAKIVSTSKFLKMENGAEDALIVNVNCNGISKQIELIGGSGYVSPKNKFALEGLNFTLSYGAKYLQTPFYVKLKDFQVERYSGSMSPSSFASEVSVIDGDKEIDYKIFMNNVLNYKGYRLFQSSYDKDEKGTILSVNHDWWGTLLTYVGYGLLFLGIVLTFFSYNTRFRILSMKLKLIKQKTFLLLLVFGFSFSSSIAMELEANVDSLIQANLIDATHAKRAEQLLVQDNGGRVKPLSTLSTQYIRKISRKQELYGQSATQILIGMMSNPVAWGNIPIIKISNPELKNVLDTKEKLASFIQLFEKDGTYKLSKFVEDAYKKQPRNRDKFDKDVIAVDERINLCYLIFNGGFLRLFPLANDSNNVWHPYSKNELFSSNDSLFVTNIMSMYFNTIKSAKENKDWATATEILDYIQKFQEKYGAKVIPATYKTKWEVYYNNLQPFSKLFMSYFILGFLLLVFVIMQIFKNRKWLNVLVTILKWLIYSSFALHTIGLIVRGVISGHAPWSNGYESMIYISWATLLSGVLFSRKSVLTLVATTIVASLLLMVAHLNWLDPEITNLVPVLKSYWLMIHVAIITASYGFLALGTMLGLFALWLIFIGNFSGNRKLNLICEEITIINEKSLTIGLYMLTIGTFLGGIWANESWGRYWGWDPKETWAMVSILVYAIILHLRFIPALQNKYVFNLASLVGIWSIIMTYFGVNYYLSGLHSYAAGDPMPIPSFVYYLIGIMVLSAILAKLNFKSSENEN